MLPSPSGHLPFDQDFFEPRAEFVDWFHATPWLRYRRIVEGGAGRGLFAKALREKGLEVVAIDPLTRPSYHTEIEIGDAAAFNYSADDVLVIARPCHDGFMERAYKRALHYGCSDLLYIGLERNIEQDFGDEWEIEKVFDTAGQEGEHVWRVYGPKDKCRIYGRTDRTHDFCEITKAQRNGADEYRLVNDMGGYMPVDLEKIVETRMFYDGYQHHFDPTIFEKYSKPSAEAAHNSDDGVYHPERGDYGWVGPDGAWWGCGSRHHDTLLARCFGISAKRARSTGWIKAYGTFWANEDFTTTPEQMKTLVAHGYTEKQERVDRQLADLPKEEQRAVRAAAFKTRAQLDGD